jgi:hypothetical protein
MMHLDGIDEAPQGKSEDGHHLPLPLWSRVTRDTRPNSDITRRALARALPAEVNTI